LIHSDREKQFDNKTKNKKTVTSLYLVGIANFFSAINTKDIAIVFKLTAKSINKNNQELTTYSSEHAPRFHKHTFIKLFTIWIHTFHPENIIKKELTHVCQQQMHTCINK
jgi:hypothetical protein